MVQTNLENSRLALHLVGRIDSNNALETEREIMDAVNANPGADIVMDAKALEYISSAGLRVLMKLRKLAKKALPVLNVSPEVYDIFEVTGFIELLDVRKRMREISVEGCQELGSGANGTVYRYTPDEMIKVFRPELTLPEIEAEREAAKKVFLLGVPSAIAFDTVKVGEQYGTMYELLKAGTLTERIGKSPNGWRNWRKNPRACSWSCTPSRCPRATCPRQIGRCTAPSTSWLRNLPPGKSKSCTRFAAPFPR